MKPKKCGMPNCNQVRMSIGRRGENSPTPKSPKRASWCRYHKRGKGKAERIAYMESRKNA